jgi:DNA polymerase I-like protein with 3'-5' exonuclease and polymerase domains
LDFIASIYNDHYVYWKDESKDWDPKVGEAQNWTYNCKDVVATYEANGHLDEMVKAFGFERQVSDQMEFCETAFRGMLRGFPIDFAYRKKLASHPDSEADDGLIASQMKELKRFLNVVLGFPIDPSSPKQIHWLCYDIFQLPHVKKPGSNTLTADKDAIAQWLRSCEPLYRPLLQAIADFRSLQVFRNTFALAPVDPDGNFRCSIAVASQVTFRWSSSKDAFGYGTNMANLPKGDED